MKNLNNPANKGIPDPPIDESDSELSSEEPAAQPEGQEKSEPGEKKKKKKKKKEGKPITLGTSRGIETMFRTSYRTNMDLSSLADNKANMMIGINGIIISILLASISPKMDANPWLLGPTAWLLVCCLVSIVYAVLSALPRVYKQVITLEDVRTKNKNILFFGNFASMNEDDYIVGMRELLQDVDRLYLNMIRDIYGLGSVLEKKFRLLRISYNAFMVGLVGGVVFFIIALVTVVQGL